MAIKSIASTPTVQPSLIPETRMGLNTPWRVWWVISVAILIIGAFIHLTGYNFQLPYVSTIDEIDLFVDSMAQHGTYTVRPPMFVGFPPGIYVLDMLSQDIVLSITHGQMIDHIVDALALARFASTCAAIMSGLFIGLIARRLTSNNVAGWLAMCWLFLPANISYDEIANQAMPQAWMVFFWALAILFAVTSFRSRSRVWPVLSVIAGLGAIFFKYSEFLSILPGFLVTFWHVYEERQSGERLNKRWLMVFLVQILACIAVGLWMLLGFNMLAIFTISRPSQQFLSGNLSRVVDINQLGKVIGATFAPFSISPLVIGLILIIGSILYLRRGKMILAWSFIAGALVTNIILVTLYSPYDYNLPRYTAPGCMATALLLAFSIMMTGEWLIIKVQKSSAAIMVVRLVLVGTTALWLVISFLTAWTVAAARTAPETRRALALWGVDNLPPGGVVLDQDNHRVFNKEYGGYQGVWREYWVGDIRSQPVQEWRALGYKYAVVSEYISQDLEQSDYANQIFALKQFPPSDSPIPANNWQGPHVVVYQLSQPQVAADYELGNEIKLVGYDVSSRDLHPSDVVTLTLYWHPVQVPKDNYNVFVHMYLPEKQEIVAQADGTPATPKRPTLSWTDLNETLVSQPFQLTLPQDITPGCYPLVIGLYNYQTGERLRIGDRDSIELMPLCVGGETF